MIFIQQMNIIYHRFSYSMSVLKNTFKNFLIKKTENSSLDIDLRSKQSGKQWITKKKYFRFVLANLFIYMYINLCVGDAIKIYICLSLCICVCVCIYYREKKTKWIYAIEINGQNKISNTCGLLKALPKRFYDYKTSFLHVHVYV